MARVSARVTLTFPEWVRITWLRLRFSIREMNFHDKGKQ